MPTPTPTPTATQKVDLVDITLLDIDTVETMIAADDDQDISDAKWAATLLDIDRWNGELKDETNEIKKVDVIEFFENNISKTRLDFRNRVRLRYGQTVLINETEALSNIQIPTTTAYF